MSSTIGNILKITIFGESHSEAIGMTIDGFPSGIDVDEDVINGALKRRNPNNAFTTSRKENDFVNFLSGVFNEKTTGAPITFILANNDTIASDYTEGNVRPGHADLTNYIKYNGFNDYRGGGFSSGRLTACFIVLGELCKPILLKYGIRVGSHIVRIGKVKDRDFDLLNIDNEVDQIEHDDFPVLNESAKQLMLEEIYDAMDNDDSVGGELETVITNCPIGLGEPYFNSVESSISQLLFSVGGIKGVLFGDGLDFATNPGSKMNDQMKYENGSIKYLSNHNGGINGGISNGDTIKFKSIIKAPSSIGKFQQSINIKSKENIDLLVKGRHDSCIVQKVRYVVDSLMNYMILDLLMSLESKNI